jgi:hypothetical protein
MSNTPHEQARINKWKRDHRGRCAIGDRKRNYRQSYGITVEQYDVLSSQQNGVCAICGRPPVKRRLAVDHNHTTGQIRGLLCIACNTLVGFWELRGTEIQSYLESSDAENET